MWRKVLDARLYRAAFAPFFLALVVAAFSLTDRPHALGSPLAPDAFDGARAFASLQGLAAQYPDRRPGSPGDSALARVVERAFRASFCPPPSARGCSSVTVRHTRGQTIDGQRALETVVATRLGQPGPGIVVLAHRDAAGGGAAAELSGTAALMELARVYGGRTTKRTLTLVSTSGGSGGAAGAAQLAGALPEGDKHPNAVLVLGDVASEHARRPWVLPWSTGPRLAPVRLRRTLEQALRQDTGEEPGGVRPVAQLARLALPFGIGEEAPLNAAGVAAVELQASGERGPAAGAPISEARLRGFGRAALRAVTALDEGPDLREVPGATVVVLDKVLPPWVMRLLVGMLLAPLLLATVDGVARVRRRKGLIAPWLRWLVGLALPFAAAAAVARLMGLAGLFGPVPGAVPAGRVGVSIAGVALTAAAFALGAVAVRPLHRALAARGRHDDGGAAAALAVTMTVLAGAVWLVNPFAAALLVAPAHLWMLVALPEQRLPRPLGPLLVLGALVPFVVVLAVFAAAVGASVLQLPWSLLLLVAGGQLGVLSLVAYCVAAACGVGALRLAWRRRADRPEPATASVRGPMGYAGPGSLGGTDSAMRARR